MGRYGIQRTFLYIVPIALLFAAGIFVASTRKLIPVVACSAQSQTGEFEKGAETAYYEGQAVFVPSKIAGNPEGKQKVLGSSNPSDKWIEVSLGDQKVRAWDGNQLFLESPVSTGLPWFPTPTGEFRIWIKLRYTRMVGGSGALYYNLPNVPFVMYFANDAVPGWRGYSLHGTYWHNDFGRVHSHGCVNLPTSVAEKLYYWTTPVLPDGQSSVTASPSNPGTRVIIHD